MPSQDERNEHAAPANAVSPGPAGSRTPLASRYQQIAHRGLTVARDLGEHLLDHRARRRGLAFRRLGGSFQILDGHDRPRRYYTARGIAFSIALRVTWCASGTG